MNPWGIVLAVFFGAWFALAAIFIWLSEKSARYHKGKDGAA